MDISPFYALLQLLEEKDSLHISVCDLSGILQHPALELPFSSRIHSVPYCNTAKSTKQGYRLCLKCKEIANRKAREERKPFFGCCIFGLYELAYPVVIQGMVKCILYLGNVKGKDKVSAKRRRRGCLAAHVEENLLQDLYAEAAEGYGEGKLLSIAKVLEAYLLAMWQKEELCPKEEKRHWAVSLLLEYGKSHYAYPITLRDLSSLYYFNEKYVGRLFKEKTGITFHQYLTNIRLERACILLEEGEKSMTQIALECGFESSSYFNRCFQKAFSTTPRQYQKEYVKS